MQFPPYRSRHVIFLLLTLAAFNLTGCERDLPFTYRYLSPSTVEVNYQGTTYVLDRNQQPVKAPFAYRFESDGDLDIVLNGEEYEIDSPYDRDSKRKKKKRRSSRRKRR